MRSGSFLRQNLPPFAAGLCITAAISIVLKVLLPDDSCVVVSPAEVAAELSPPVRRDRQPAADLTAVSDRNASLVRIFCWIMVPYMMPLLHMMTINESWGPRCDSFAFLASKLSIGALSLPVIDVNETSTYGANFNKVEWRRIWLSAWQVHRKSLQSFDYFLLVKTANYVIVENLRHLLRRETPDEAQILGRRMVNEHPRLGEAGTYLAANAGIVLSRAALDRLVRQGFSGANLNATTRHFCTSSSVSASYDIQLSECLLSLGVRIKDSRDNQGRERFHPAHPCDLIEENRMPGWLRNSSYYRPVKACLTCPSPLSVTFFGVEEIYKTDAMIHHVRPWPDA